MAATAGVLDAQVNRHYSVAHLAGALALLHACSTLCSLSTWQEHQCSHTCDWHDKHCNAVACSGGANFVHGE